MRLLVVPLVAARGEPYTEIACGSRYRPFVVISCAFKIHRESEPEVIIILAFSLVFHAITLGDQYSSYSSTHNSSYSSTHISVKYALPKLIVNDDLWLWHCGQGSIPSQQSSLATELIPGRGFSTSNGKHQKKLCCTLRLRQGFKTTKPTPLPPTPNWRHDELHIGMQIQWKMW